MGKGIPHILVATPLGKNGMIHIGTAGFCADVASRPNVVWAYTLGVSHEMSRNTLVERQLRSDNGETTHFLFLDSDVTPPHGTIERLLALDEDIVTGLTPIFANDMFKWNVASPTDENKWIRCTERLPSEPFYTSKCGAGCMLVKRRVFEAIGWPWFHMEYQPMGDGDVAVKTGEDVWFCQRAKACGFRILADPKTLCHHYNQVDMVELYNTIATQIEYERNLALSPVK